MNAFHAVLPPSIELLEALYPPPVRIGASHEVAWRPGDCKIMYTAFPSVERARIIVSSGAHHASARAIARQLTGQRPRTRIARRLVSWAAQCGVLERVPRSQVTVTGVDDEERFEQRLARTLGVPSVHLTLPVGPPRANRKPILQVSDFSGDSLAFVKVGHNSVTRPLVVGEGRSLRAIAQLAGNAIEVPRVLAEFDWYGSHVLVMSALQIPARRVSGAASRYRLEQLAAQIASLAGPVRRTRWREHPLRERLRSGLDELGDRGRPFRVELESLDDESEMSVGSWHGDFNAGNFALLPNVCQVWDWERFEVGVPLGFDILHHDLHRWITIERMSPEDAAERLLARSSELLVDTASPVECRATARVYLLTLAERYLRDDQEGAGADLGRVTSWLLPALTRYGSGRAER